MNGARSKVRGSALQRRASLRRWPVLVAAGLLACHAAAFDLQGHRGARGLAPENTLAGFAAATAIGVDTLELDTMLTKDGIVVISHEPRLNPNLTRDASGRWIEPAGAAIRSLTLAEVQTYDVGRPHPGTRYAQGFPQQQAADGERIPALAALFEQVRRSGNETIRFNIETKISLLEPDLAPAPEDFVRSVLAVADRYGMRARITLESFDWRTLKVAQRLAPEVPTVCLSSQQSGGNNVADTRWTAGHSLAASGSVPKLVKEAGCAIWSPYFGDLSAALLAEAHALKLPVAVWTVNEPAQIEQMLELGVDAIISDRPDRVRAAMATRGIPLPPRAP
jgi:glycerophosphoryl diester phosphodiesterase